MPLEASSSTLTITTILRGSAGPTPIIMGEAGSSEINARSKSLSDGSRTQAPNS